MLALRGSVTVVPTVGTAVTKTRISDMLTIVRFAVRTWCLRASIAEL